MVKLPPELKKKAFSVKQRKFPHFKLALTGESKACTYLIDQGYTIVGRNLTLKHLELDILAHNQANNELSFIEVKTRSRQHIPAYLAINAKKIQNLNRFAGKFNQLSYKHFRKRYQYSIDAICITLNKDNEINHFKNVSWWS